MAVDWVGIGPELLLSVDRSAPRTLGSQIQQQLRDAIRNGRLTNGERLPSSRELATQLDVSRGMVVECYTQLESEGYLASHIGSGTHVAYPAPATAPIPPDTTTTPPRFDVDFEYGVPDLARFPIRDWAWALSIATKTITLGDLGDETGAGNSVLRDVIAGYLRRVRASTIAADHVVTCPGFRHGLNVVFHALASAGVTTVALEDPGPVDHDIIASRAGLNSVAVPVDEDGIDVDALSATAARAVVVTPAHQCPTGVALSPRRRQQLIEWARSTDAYVIEDDYDAEFRYDRQPVGSIQGLAPDRVLAMGSVSKTLALTLRLGWITTPPDLTDTIVTEKQLLGRGAPGLDQLALATLIESGRFDKHLRHMRSVYARRRTILADALAAHAPTAHLSGMAAGCHAVIELPADTDEQHVVEACAARAVRVYGMSGYRTNHTTHPPQLVVGFGSVSEQAINHGIHILGDTLRSRRT